MSPPETLRERQLKVREDAILDGARELLAKHGYAELNLNDLVEKLGISKATLYQHFASKDALVAAVVARSMREVEGTLDEVAEQLGPLEQIEHMMRRGLVAKLTHMGAHGAPLPATVRAEPTLARQHKKVTDHTAELVDAAKAAGEIAAHYDTDVIVRMVHGIFDTDYADLMKRRRMSAETLADHLVTILLDGIRTRPVAATAPAKSPRKKPGKGLGVALLALGLGSLACGHSARAEAPRTELGVSRTLDGDAVSLDALLAAARSHATQGRRADAAVEVARAQRDLGRAELWPTLTTTLGYTFNQNEAVVRIPDGSGGFDSATITAQNQVDLNVVLRVPLVDLRQWSRNDAADQAIAAEAASADAQRVAVDRAVVRAYTELVGNSALVEAAKVALAAAEASRAVTQVRIDAGFADDAAMPRAEAEVARAREAIASAELGVKNARRSLATLTGLDVSGAAPPVATALEPEPPLASWLGDLDTLPAVRAANLRIEAARARADAEWDSYVPRLDAQLAERVTNANGFGDAASFSAGLVATWTLDRRGAARADAEGAAARQAEVERDAAKDDARAAVIDAWNRIEALRARADAAAVAAASQAKARDVIRTRFQSGAGTQLDLTSAERDVFQAEVARVQALSELAFARAELRLAAGRALAPTPTAPAGATP